MELLANIISDCIKKMYAKYKEKKMVKIDKDLLN